MFAQILTIRLISNSNSIHDTNKKWIESIEKIWKRTTFLRNFQGKINPLKYFKEN